jgi:transposase
MTDLKEKNLPRGRPPVTTPEMDAEIDVALLAGESHRSIATRLGISRDVINRHAAGRRGFVRAPAPQRQPPTQS